MRLSDNGNTSSDMMINIITTSTLINETIKELDKEQE